MTTSVINTEPWTQQAVCFGKYDLFDPHGPDESAYDKAVAICHTCPVMAQCNDYANRTDARGGVWGGRVRLEHPKRTERTRTPGRNRKEIAHATQRGYQQHIRRGEKACDACRIANTEASKRRRIRAGK